MLMTFAPLSLTPRPLCPRLTRLLLPSLVVLGVLGALTVLSAPEARAQSVTITDDEELQSSVERILDKLLYPQGALAAEQVLLMQKYRDYLKKLDWLFSRHVDPQDVLLALRQALADPALLGPTHPDLAQAFAQAFPGYTVPDEGFDTHYRRSARRLMKTYRQVLAATRRLSRQAQTNAVDLDVLREAIETEATSWQRAKDLALQIDARTAEEMLLLRQTLALETTLRALLGAAQTNRRAEARAALERALGLPAH